MSQGWISLHRKVLENPIIKPKGKYSDFEAWIYLLLRASHDNMKVRIGSQLLFCEPGDIITSQKKLCLQFKWGNTKLRNFLKLLETDSMIEVRTAINLTQITILNYRDLQQKQIINKQKANSKQTVSKSKANTYNNNNNLNNSNNIEERYLDFKIEVEKISYGLYGKKVPKKMINAFVSYWCEPNRTNKKMKFELEKTWATKRRLLKWQANDFDGYYKEWLSEQDVKKTFKKERVRQEQIRKESATTSEMQEILGETLKKMRRRTANE